MPPIWRRRILLPAHVAGGHPLLPDPDPAPAGGGTPPAPAPPAPSTPPAPPAPATAPPAGDGGGDPGFPAGTPVADMTPEQAVAYWKHQARRHEGRHLDALGLKSPDELAQLRKAAQEVEELRKAQMTEHELAIAAARDQAAGEVRQTYGGRLAVAEFRAASGGRVTAEVLQELRIDPAAYLDDKGEPDTAAIAAAVARLAPPTSQQPAPPVDLGGGVGGGQGPSLQQEIAAAEAAGEWAKAASLKTVLLAQQTSKSH